MEQRAIQTEQSHQTKGLIRLTMACNERCGFCNVPMEDYAVMTPPEAELQVQVEALVDSGAQTATISGGEPTLLRRRLLALVKQIRQRGVPFVEIQTNAILIDTQYAIELADAGATSAFVSLLSHIPEHHDALCGTPDAFGRCLTGIDALLDAGLAVTLNPVTAHQTQSLVTDYVHFVAKRLPRVQAISLSAIQPHGRAAHHLDLMPEYQVLRTEIPNALAAANEYGIRLLNPYCGLPLCVGWTHEMERSVEAQEARFGQWQSPTGVDNHGNKRHGPPCSDCAVRTRCGGAWHAYWDVRGGNGLHAPETLTGPWHDGANTPFQSLTEIQKVSEAIQELRRQTTPTKWVLGTTVSSEEMDALIQAGATDWVWRTGGEPESHKGMLVGIRNAIERQIRWPDQAKCRFFWWVQGELSAKQAHRWVGLAYAMGITGVVLETTHLERSFWEACERRYIGLRVEQVHGGP